MQSQFITKLIELLGNASEALLLQCLKKKDARSVYIPSNKNGNQRRSAIITFASAEEMEAAQTKPIRFNNHLLFWQKHRESENKYVNKSKDANEKYITRRFWCRCGQESI